MATNTIRTIRPRDLIDEMLDLHVWWGTEGGRSFSRGWTADVMNRLASPLRNPEEADYVWIAQSVICRQGAPILVQPDMSELVEHASKSMPPQPFRRDDLPADFGFMYLVRPVEILDLNGAGYAIRAITWGITSIAPAGTLAKPGDPKGVILGMYTALSDDPDNAHNAWLLKKSEEGEWVPDLSLLHLQAMEFGRDYTNTEFVTPPRDVENADPELLAHAEVCARDLLRFVLASWSLMQQRIASTYRERPSRPQIRRWARRKAIPPEVTVVTLRRTEQSHEPGEDHAAVNYSHRWFVTGHWRRIKHPRTEEERVVWVSPHIKGPDHLPLIFKDRVYNFRR